MMNINAAAALGSDKTLNLKVDPAVGTIDFTQTAQILSQVSTIKQL